MVLKVWKEAQDRLEKRFLGKARTCSTGRRSCQSIVLSVRAHVSAVRQHFLWQRNRMWRRSRELLQLLELQQLFFKIHRPDGDYESRLTD